MTKNLQIDTGQRAQLLGGLAGYAYVKKALASARAIGLIGMRDLVNYVCMTLIYGERWYSDPRITALMTRVKRGDLEFDEAIKLLPPSKPTES